VDPSQAAPLYAFVPYGSSREPGLILASQSGEIWFWNNIGVGLAGGEQYSKILLELQSNENVNSLTRLDVRSFPSHLDVHSSFFSHKPSLRHLPQGACSG
jgi:nuclear pore complex protein Nup133